jgi:ribosomal protein S18 acetylase RimI-like enzyme
LPLKRHPLFGILLTDPSSVTYTLRLFTAQDSLEALTALLHEAYAAHAAAGRRFFASYQAPADTRRRISRGECWVAMDGEELIGTITVAAPYLFPAGYPAPIPSATYYQLAVRPTHQGRGLGRQLVALAEQRSRDRGISNLAIDTSSQAIALIDWYRRLGYRDVGRWCWEVTNYESIVLAKTLS